MANPFEGIITSEMKTLHKQAIEAMLEDDGCTIPCRVVYVSNKLVDCINCKFDHLKGRSANIYEPGGPIPFPNGSICAYCNGRGLIQQPPKEDNVFLMVIWDYKSFINFDLNTQSPEGKIQTLSKISTLPKLKRANKLIVGTDIEHLERHTFQRDGEPNMCGLANDFITTMWKRIS